MSIAVLLIWIMDHNLGCVCGGWGAGQKLMGEEIKFMATNLIVPPRWQEVSFPQHDNKAPATSPGDSAVWAARCQVPTLRPPPNHQPTFPPVLPPLFMGAALFKVSGNLTQNQTLDGESVSCNFICTIYRILMRSETTHRKKVN